ncbi:SnoaL-like protein [Algoriphagus ratkowskyi]|uniref:Nuclear transport factor 2 family protein n=1 Tax=Algoriphagus ratkowskyi TaxID=57028 RepID=A0A2W7QTK4_9BACT|nr:nuclear transport factor 2 family protein [Algoriphagus ratkowskyi]PZX51574.1 SnoaL-like protein [Algoriphagus ratkowskyi]TXD78849.1 nuclear transport factor 2 family protein [Algoriphagus ratkowskyi]
MKSNFNYLMLLTLSIFLWSGCSEQREKVEDQSAIGTTDDEAKVKEVLMAYKAGVEALSTTGLNDLFIKDSEVFESGGVEGSFAHYQDHHLSPELKAFKSFSFSDYKVTVQIDLPYAFTTETYDYTIALASNERTIVQKGVATSILKKVDAEWKILKTHTSARAKKSEAEAGN